MTVQGLFSSKSAAPAQICAKPRFAIVGRGFSGMMTAIALMKTVRTPFHLQLFDPNSSVSGGQALSSASASTILNTRVRDLSVSAGDADDFNDWLCSNAEFRAAVPAAIPGFRQIFVPKEIFSDYVYQRFSEALSARKDITVQVCPEPVVAIRRSHGSRFLLESGNCANPLFDMVVLATGYGLPGTEEPEQDLSPVRAQRLIARPHTVLLGSGIRVVDQLLQLRDAGYAGQITILSRHGFLPQSHTPNSADPVFPAEALPSNLPEILRFIRTACHEAEREGRSWQSVMNGLRRHARSLWRGLPAHQKRQFNRHLRAIYDSHRNRLPEAIYARLQTELASGNTILRRGISGRQGLGGLFFRPAGSQSDEIVHAERILDCRCRGPQLTSPLLASLVNEGLALPDELSLGLAVNQCGQPCLDDGSVVEGLFAVGPLGLGSLPDIDLVPEIVNQAYAVGERIAMQFYPQSKAV
ncbi:putative NAD(P)/FAD-binding protein YdhS [Rhizobium mesoamericanum]|uniref:FAD/NAD(P)-binding protein n=1 Tax=Rhizobium mesoamericanum TaxID=1079800 RepID=UPI00277EA4C7|nr:FAD/NAD(P)-binding protein [Rhizobium mesoamericanum]MDQ0560015.1 putative NAD(P)/FAD-binding protein YdhS [Rhizobium mesoamericanum]